MRRPRATGFVPLATCVVLHTRGKRRGPSVHALVPALCGTGPVCSRFKDCIRSQPCVEYIGRVYMPLHCTLSYLAKQTSMWTCTISFSSAPEWKLTNIRRTQTSKNSSYEYTASTSHHLLYGCLDARRLRRRHSVVYFEWNVFRMEHELAWQLAQGEKGR